MRYNIITREESKGGLKVITREYISDRILQRVGFNADCGSKVQEVIKAILRTNDIDDERVEVLKRVLPLMSNLELLKLKSQYEMIF